MNKGGQKTGLQSRTRFPYEPRVIGGRLVVPAELQPIAIILDAAEVEITGKVWARSWKKCGERY